jgi:hypothetical protein
VYHNWLTPNPLARVVKSVDTGDLKSPDSNVVPVQVRLRAPIKINDLRQLRYSRLNPKKSHSRRIVDSGISLSKRKLMYAFARLSPDQQMKLIKEMILPIAESQKH